MSKVYVVNRSGHDFSSSEKFGTIIYLSEGKIDPYQVSKMYREFVDKMKDSNKDDHILVTGLTIMNMMAGAIFARKHGRLNILQYYSEGDRYKERRILLDELL